MRETRHPERESPLRLTLAQAVLKGAHTDMVVEKSTELGVTAIALFTCARTVARPPAERLERWRRIAASAAKQSGRTRVPEIRGPLDLAVVLQSAAAEAAVLLHSEAAPWRRVLPAAAPPAATVIVGPEGGFAEDEVDSARRAGCLLAGLGPRILRGETAGITAVALLQHLWGDLGG